MVLELTTVADDLAVLFDGARVVRLDGLAPGTDHEVEGVPVRTLPRPPGARLATVATVNDLHFGEVECGRLDGVDLGPILRAEPGERPYPDVMNEGAADEIAAIAPDAVVAKGDLTADGRPEELRRFCDVYGRFGDALLWERGNHDHGWGARGPQERVVDGLRLALLDTAVEGRAGGTIDGAQLDWLDELAARSDRPVLVMGHHPLADVEEPPRPDEFGLSHAASVALVEVVARRPALVAYTAGHTHRNRVRRHAGVPFVEIACVKDFPGAWAEYRVFEGGLLQVVHRIATPGALRWSERCRALFGGFYPAYAMGALDERCFPIELRS